MARETGNGNGVPYAASDAETIQRRAEILKAYAERPLGQPLREFVAAMDMKHGEWHRCMSNRAFRSNVQFIDRERVRFSTAHISDAIADVLDVQFNLAMRGDSQAAERIMRVSGLISYQNGRGGAGDDYDPQFVESFSKREEEKPQDITDARQKEEESRRRLDEMLDYVDSEKADEPVDLSRTD